uniref:Ovule protein n=1 Tax=Strongyloides stercoralis TaxID=6248 RepID=A0A0K0ENJ2_STRER
MIRTTSDKLISIRFKLFSPTSTIKWLLGGPTRIKKKLLLSKLNLSSYILKCCQGNQLLLEAVALLKPDLGR